MLTMLEMSFKKANRLTTHPVQLPVHSDNYSWHMISSGGKVQGTGPLYRPWGGNTHEFNRHHAGLAVDIMLNQQNDAEVV